MTPTPPGAPQAFRRHDLDRLRILACLIQFLFHTGKVFDQDPIYHVKSLIRPAGFDWLTQGLHNWRMPLFFLLSGWVAMLTLQRRPPLQFLRSRLQRLLPPLLLGLLLFAPLIKYIERLDGRDLRPGGYRLLTEPPPDWLVFYPRFFTRLVDFSWSHLWFLAYLLLLSGLLLPLLLRIRDRGTPFRAPTWGMVLGPLLLILPIELILRPLFGDYPNLFSDWANIAEFSVFLLLGAALARWPEFEAMLRRGWLGFLLLGVTGTILTLGWHGEAMGHLGRGLAAWGVVGGGIGIAGAFSWPPRSYEGYLGEATLPLYVLHHLPLVAIAFSLQGINLAVGWKFLLICCGSAVLTLAVYHYLVRPYDPMRRLFGLRPTHALP